LPLAPPPLNTIDPMYFCTTTRPPPLGSSPAPPLHYSRVVSRLNVNHTKIIKYYTKMSWIRNTSNRATCLKFKFILFFRHCGPAMRSPYTVQRCLTTGSRICCRTSGWMTRRLVRLTSFMTSLLQPGRTEFFISWFVRKQIQNFT
jgi:hypothetical protein